MVNERDSRTALLIGKEGLSKLREARIAVIGLGGVGGYAVEALVRAGIAEILLVDFDRVQESNINRQLIADYDSIGMLKTELYARRLTKLDPQLIVCSQTCFLDSSNMAELLDGYHYVIDAIDSLNSKIDLLDYCHRNNKFVVSVLGAGRRLDPSLVRSGDISQSSACPLARRVRKSLRERGITSGISAVWSIEEASPAVKEQGPERSPIGSISYMPAIMGLTAASILIRKISYS